MFSCSEVVKLHWYSTDWRKCAIELYDLLFVELAGAEGADVDGAGAGAGLDAGLCIVGTGAPFCTWLGADEGLRLLSVMRFSSRF